MIPDPPDAAKNLPLISVCIPVFNCREYIGQAIASVLSQTFTDFELVVVDDCSTDGSFEVVRAMEDPRIRVIRNESNLGLVDNWNAAVRAGRAPLVKLLCADDLLYPDCLRKQAAVFQQEDAKGVALVCARRDVIDSSGKIVIKSRGWKNDRGRIAGGRALRTIVRSGVNPIGEPHTCLFRRKDFERCGGFAFPDSSYVQDLALYCLLLQIGDLYVSPESQGAFRLSRGSNTIKAAQGQARDTIAVYRTLLNHPTICIRKMDYAVGYAKAWIYAMLRRIFCNWVLRDKA